MAKLLQTLIPILFLLAAAAITVRSQTTSFYIDFNGIPTPQLVYEYAAYYPNNNNLVLTELDEFGLPLPDKRGRVLYRNGFKFYEAGKKSSFETTIKFIMKPIINTDQVYADGLAFVLQQAFTPIGYSGGSLGVFDESGQKAATFVVEFDIFGNSGVDPNGNHIGIDIESNVSKNTTFVGPQWLGQEVTARINYEEATNVITVNVDFNGEHYETSYVHDLTTVLTEDVQVGLTAATGGKVAIFEVVSWYFTSTLVNTVMAKEGNIRQVV